MRICLKKYFFLVLFLIFSAHSKFLQAQVADYPYRPVPFTDVLITDSFWQPRIETNRAVTIPFAFRQCEQTGELDNFAIAAKIKSGEQCGVYPFDDTDPYKIIEGASYTLRAHPDAKLEHYLDSVIAIIGAAQEKDGYLYTARTNNAKRLIAWAGETRWSKELVSHELYNSGHLYEAAVAHYLSTGKRTLLEVAIKNANLVADHFGPDKKKIPPGHQEIEIGLAKLYRVTGDARYIRLAKFFLDQRGVSYDGRVPWGEYAQDHKPILEQDEAVGHAVRLQYMAAGIADVVALTGDTAYQKPLNKIWENVAGKKQYITGGAGSLGMGESFGVNYDLPNMTAYSETCSEIANVLWNHRMFLLYGDGKYIDVMERTLYNALIAGISLNGDGFFYDNPLASRGQHQRSPWFDCACCPTNVSRFIPSLPSYVYAQREDNVYINLFASSSAQIKLKSQRVAISQETRYPWNGAVKIKIEPERPGEFSIFIRIPGWARNEAMPGNLYRFLDVNDDPVTLKINGRPEPVVMHEGFARILRRWKKGDSVEINFPMPVRRVIADANVAADRGRVSLQRGPIVYCAEGPDNKDGRVLNLVLPDDNRLQSSFKQEMLNGIEVITGKALGVAYENDKSLKGEEQGFTAIPYYAWAHRGPGEMTVWLARDISRAKPLHAPSVAATGKIILTNGINSSALNDEKEIKSSGDSTNGYATWLPGNDTLRVEYHFQRTEEVSEIQVYWFDDGKNYRTPGSYRLLAKFQGQWQPVYVPKKIYGVEKDRFNKVIFETVRTDELRLEVYPDTHSSCGILEWRVF